MCDFVNHYANADNLYVNLWKLWSPFLWTFFLTKIHVYIGRNDWIIILSNSEVYGIVTFWLNSQTVIQYLSNMEKHLSISLKLFNLYVIVLETEYQHKLLFFEMFRVQLGFLIFFLTQLDIFCWAANKNHFYMTLIQNFRLDWKISLPLS